MSKWNRFWAWVEGGKLDGKFCSRCGSPTFTKIEVHSYSKITGKPNYINDLQKCVSGCGLKYGSGIRRVDDNDG